ncbi:MAG: Crp/Fnr family transcriptional regulator [Clostridiales Family XIII bacterium]|jgi:CRP-like cAMP-binding protein|nr:Crp/Fnr family transcriptional regulator [Clostridiales Family XIII bacterium]
MTESDLNRIMMRTRLFSGFRPEECALLRRISKASLRSYAAGELLAGEGSLIDFFAIVTEGRLLCEKNSYGGHVELIQHYAAGDPVCLDIASTVTKRCPFRILCPDNAELLTFRYDMLMRNCAPHGALYEKLSVNMIRFLANENIKKLYKIDVLYKRSLRERILVFLRNMEARTGESAFRIYMSREQFAQYLGVNRSSLSHELSRMQKEGLFRFKKDCFELAKPPRKEEPETPAP